MTEHVTQEYTSQTWSNNTDLDVGRQSDSWELDDHLYYVIGAAVTGGVLLVVVIVLVIVLKRRRRNNEDSEAGQGKGDRTYDEIDEEEQGERETKENRKHNKKKQKTTTKTYNKKTDKPSHHPDNNNDMSAADGIELVAMDTAPDIITAHDNESIYETLDGRRSALRAKAGHVTTGNQSGCLNLGAGQDFMDSTYDHLGRFRKPRFQSLPPSVPEKRFTDPEVTTRNKGLMLEPRAIHSADFAIHNGLNSMKQDKDLSAWDQAGSTEWPKCRGRSSPTDSLRSTLTEVARQNACEGRRLLCQLTMVGVMENGKPVPVRPAAATNTYYILEPSRDSSDKEALGDSPCPKFRIKRESLGLGDEARVEGHGGSEYFILEPLEQQEELEELQDMPPCQGCQASSAHPHQGTGQWSPSAQTFLSSDHGVREQDSPHTVKYARVSSCPEQCSCTGNVKASPIPSQTTVSYGRSLSSPQRRHQADHENLTPAKKMDAEALKARIQREMIALGFLTDTEAHNDAGATQCSEDSGMLPGCKIATGNDYFILEPQQDGPEEEGSGVLQPGSLQQTSNSGERPRYQQRQQAPATSSSSSPPPLPKRNKHGRSKSETPPLTMCRSTARSMISSEEEGPVVVSLSKHAKQRPHNREGNSASTNTVAAEVEEHDEAFRPRFKSEAGILSDRHKKRGDIDC